MPIVLSAKAQKFLSLPQLALQFGQAIPAIQKSAADEATAVSRATFNSKLNPQGRPNAPVRAGRSTTDGRFAQDIIWEATQESKQSNVAMDLKRLPYYALIQEVGTGKSARILNPQGEVTIRSQRGREISARLFWASGPGGKAVAGGAGAGQQLYFSSDLKGNPRAPRRRMVIEREIEGKHYLRAGGIAGYLELSRGLTDEAKRIFLP